MKQPSWSMRAQWYARWRKHSDHWSSCELVTPYGYGSIDLTLCKPVGGYVYYLRAGFIWKGREHQVRYEDTKPISRLRAVRLANKWIRGLAERSEP